MDTSLKPLNSDSKHTNNNVAHCEMALVESEEKFRGVIEASTDAIIMAGEDEKLLLWNHGAEKIFGYKKDEILGKNYNDFIVPKEYNGSPGQALKKAVKTKKLAYDGKIINAMGLKKDGTRFPLEHTVSMWRVNGEVRLIAILRDVTEKRKLEDDLKKNHEKLIDAYSELKSLDQLKSDIITNVSHELKTPISIIKSGIEEAMDEENSSDREELLHMALKALDRQLDVVNDLVALSNIEKNKLDKKIHDMSEIISEVINERKDQANNSSVTISTEIPDDLPQILIDKDKIKHVLKNLISNAIKFNKIGGNIILKAYRKGGSLEISVSDTGVGIEEKDMGKLFRPLTQLDPSTNRNYEGTGTGLAVAKRYVEAHDGKIRAMSKLGEGTTVYFSLPIN